MSTGKRDRTMTGLTQILKLKKTKKNVLCLYSKSYLHVYHTDKHLGDDYFQTDKGLFRFKFKGFYGKSPLWFKVIGALPKKPTTRGGELD